jgi:uncharacterized protein involved in cysteine biosynthesis
MLSVPASFARAAAQLLDPAILRILLKSLLVSLALFALIGTGLVWGVDALLGWAGWSDGAFTGAGEARGAASLLVTLIALWLAWRIVAMAVIQFYAEDVVRAVEARHYPDAAARGRDLPFGRQLDLALKSGMRALIANIAALPFALVLLVTGVGAAAVFWLVNAVLLGRELQDMVWQRQQEGGAGEPGIGTVRRFALGGVTAAMLLVPFVNFLAPLLGAGAATHLLHRDVQH